MASQLAEEEEKAKNLGKLKNKQEMMIADLEGEERALGTEIVEKEAEIVEKEAEMSSLKC